MKKAAFAAALALCFGITTPALTQGPDDTTLTAKFRDAAERGNPYAQYNLGKNYANGQGVARDDVQAAAWWRKAAEQGNAPAQYNLGKMYAIGRGVTRDDAQAVAWYRKAADQMHPGAQLALREIEASGPSSSLSAGH